MNNHNYGENIAIIEGEIKKLENFEVILAVVGTIKAGKSTTINAIVGREILPNRNRPMTALPTLIYHTAKQTEPVLSFNNLAVNEFIKTLKTELDQHPEWKNNKELSSEEMQALIQHIQKGWAFKTAYHGENGIFNFLAKLNDLVRLSEKLLFLYPEHAKKVTFPFQQCRNIDQLPKIEVAFRHLTDMPANQGRLVLLDTPGPNEAGQTHLREMLNQQLQRSSAVLLVLDYTQLKSDASDSVKSQLENVPTIQKDRLFALVNKFDQKNVNSDDEEATKDIIFNDFLKEKIEREHIYPLAASHAFLANRMAAELDMSGKPKWDKEKWIEDFAIVAFGTAIDKDEWDDYDAEAIRKKIDRIIKRSKVQAPLDNAIAKTQLEAPRIALQAALGQLSKFFQDINNFCNIRLTTAKKVTDEEINSLNEAIKKLKADLTRLTKLQEDVEKDIAQTQQDEKAQVSEKASETKKEVRGELTQIFTKNRNEYRHALQQEKGKGWRLLTEKENNKRQRKMKQLETTLKDMQSKPIMAFFTSEDRDKFTKQLEDTINGIYDSVCQDMQAAIKSSLENIKQKLAKTEKDVETILTDIKKVFDKQGFHIQLTIPSIEEITKFEAESIKFEKLFETKRVTRQIPKKGVWATIARWFDLDDGYKNVKVEEFHLDQTNIQTELDEQCKKFFKDIDNYIDNIFSSLDQSWSENYIDPIHKEVQELINEINQQMEMNSRAAEEKKKIIDELTKLLKRNKQIEEDITDLQKKFSIAE